MTVMLWRRARSTTSTRPVRRAGVGSAVLLVLGCSLAAQTPDSVTRAAEAAISPAAVATYLDVLRADSLRRRETPSPALDRAAQYVAAEFGRLGLEPPVEGRGARQPPSWIQRYPLPGQRQVDYAQTNIVVVTGARSFLIAPLTTAAYLTPEIEHQRIPPSTITNIFALVSFTELGEPLTVVAGRQTAASVRRIADQLRDRTVLYVPAAGVDSVARREIITELYAASLGVLVVSDVDSARFAATAAAARRRPAPMVDDYLRAAAGPHRWPWAVTVWAGAIRDSLRGVGVDLTQLATDTTSIIRALPSAVVVGLQAHPVETPDLATVPNVVGLLQGSEPALQHQYVVIAAHLDTRSLDADTGATRAGGLSQDSLPRGTPDNTAGVAALLAIARAFRQPGMQPRRSVLFLATSGGAEAFWGAHYFASHLQEVGIRGRSSVLAANLTLDLPDRALGGAHADRTDSLWLDGLAEVEWETPPALLALAHPELALTVVDGGTAVRPTSDHFPLVQKAVPSLDLHPRPTGDSLPAAPPTTGDAAFAARAARFAFYLSHAMATTDRKLEWSAEGRRHLVPVFAP